MAKKLDKAIDFHVHAFPDAIAARAISSLEAAAPWKATAGGTVADLVASMDQAGVAASVVCAIATKPDQAEGILSWCRSIRTDRVIPLPSVHPKTPDAPAFLAKIAREGFPGIKLHPMYQEFAFDDPQMDAIYQAAIDCGLFIVSHCGNDVAFPDDDRASAVRIRRVLDKFPGLKLVCTHMGGWRDWQSSLENLAGRDVYMETSFSIGQMPAELFGEFIARHGIDRIMMGSDWPWARQDSTVQDIKSLGLDRKQTSAILHGNARRLLGCQSSITSSTLKAVHPAHRLP